MTKTPPPPTPPAPTSTTTPPAWARRLWTWAGATRARRLGRVAGAALLVSMGVAVPFALSLVTTLQTPAPSKLLVDRRGEPLGEVEGDAGRLGFWPMPYVMPERLLLAVREAEDRHFYNHGGVHLPSVGRALWQNLSNARVVSGASTISMQVARLQSGRDRHVLAKAQEAVEALLLVDAYGHDAVLRHYLTLAPYGNRVHGAVRAARFYFDKPVQDLSWLQAAYLAALPQSPGRMNPFTDVGRARGLARAHRILRLLHERGHLSADDLAVALSSDLALVRQKPRPTEALHATLAFSARARGRDDVIVRTTLDLEIQQRVAAIVKQNVESHRHLGAGNGAALVLDKDSGDVLAWVGSADYFDAEAKGAIDYLTVKRSPGSALKPFVYGLALQSRRVNAASILADTPMDLVTEQGKSYVPKNINRAFLGPVSLREALGNSRNIPALRVLADLGVEPVLSLLHDGGVRDVSFSPGAYGLGVALGNLHVTPLELANLYRALGNGGVARPERLFLEDDVDDDDVLNDDVLDDETGGARLLDADVAALVTHILADPAARRPSFAAGSALDYDIAVAVKTGTSQGFRDGWTAAYNDRLVVVAWIGNADWRRMNNLGGLSGTAEAVHAIFDVVTPLRAPHVAQQQSFVPPASSTARTVCPLSGKRAGPDCPHEKTEHFLAGTEPEESCDVHRRVHVDVRNGLLAGPGCDPRFVEERLVVDLAPAFQGWARAQRVPAAPRRESPWCAGAAGPDDGGVATVSLTEPKDAVRFRFDPDTPPEFSTLRLVANVEPPDEEVVFLVDGAPVAQVGFPHEARWTLSPGTHTIQAALARRTEASAPVTIVVSP